MNRPRSLPGELRLELTPPQDVLEVINGPEDGRQFPLVEDSFLLGRGSEATLALPPDPSLSRRHARLTRVAGSYVLEDLDSLQGTMVNGRRLTEPTTVQYGDWILLGSTVLELVPGARRVRGETYEQRAL
jgi:pSer/pThr/pTyr-binding forkhead associated (FHA) protein